MDEWMDGGWMDEMDGWMDAMDEMDEMDGWMRWM